MPSTLGPPLLSGVVPNDLCVCDWILRAFGLPENGRFESLVHESVAKAQHVIKHNTRRCVSVLLDKLKFGDNPYCSGLPTDCSKPC